ncbi:MAG: flagellar biosynthesis protein [Pseudomonadota bacterium]
MSIGHLLEDFGTFAGGNLVEMTDVLLEEQRLEAFENGYQAGWDDSIKATQDDTGRFSSEFSQTLSDMSFTYQEAYSGLLKGLRPLIDQIVGTVVPDIAKQTLIPRISEILDKLVAEHGRLPTVITVAPGQSRALEQIVDEHDALPVTLREDPTLVDGQLGIRIGDMAEQEIDLGALLSSISGAIDAHFNTEFSEQKDIA